jgi:hypothetical protein
MTIEEIKDYCIQIDEENLEGIERFGYENDLKKFYDEISFKELLEIFAQYNGLLCYRADEPENYAKSYSIDILTIIENL